jgi:hydrogenase/urease accessory protein HupE
MRLIGIFASMTVTGSNQWLRCLIGLVLLSVASPAFAHSEQGVAIDFWGGFFHPIFGPDHVIAMVAVGLWGAFLGVPGSGSCRSCFHW